METRNLQDFSQSEILSLTNLAIETQTPNALTESIKELSNEITKAREEGSNLPINHLLTVSLFKSSIEITASTVNLVVRNNVLKNNLGNNNLHSNNANFLDKLNPNQLSFVLDSFIKPIRSIIDFICKSEEYYSVIKDDLMVEFIESNAVTI